MEYTIDLQGKTFSIFFSKKQLAKGLEIQNGKIGLQEAIPELAIKDLVRGSFLGGGSINNSAVKQMEDIKWIKQNHKFGELTKPLQEIAELRMKYPDKTLIELGQMLEEHIGKSGVNHRLKAISKLAEELRNKEKKS